MSALTVYGRGNSVNVQKVLWCCEELALRYERIDAGGRFGVVDTDDYRRLNPNGLVPTIVDDGFVLWESNAIVRYLGARHGRGSLWSESEKERARADCWMDWSSTVLWPALRPLFLALVCTPPDERDAAAVEQARAASARALGLLDGHLARRKWVAGDAFSMGDVPVGCIAWRWLALPIERETLPNVQRWFDSLAERPAYARVVMQPLS
jgi:glutathione S-transferase